MDELIDILNEIDLPYAYDHFAENESPAPPFVVHLTSGNNNFSADGRAYFKANEIHLELYTDMKDPELERKIETVLDSHGIFYDKTETWIESEKLYEVLFIFDKEA